MNRKQNNRKHQARSDVFKLLREGLLEAELRDVMSLDNEVIGEVYRYSLPPAPSLIRLPPLLWARLRRDLEDQLEERWLCGIVTLTFNNRYGKLQASV